MVVLKAFLGLVIPNQYCQDVRMVFFGDFLAKKPKSPRFLIYSTTVLYDRNALLVHVHRRNGDLYMVI